MLQLAAMGLYATHDVVIKSLGAIYPAMQILFFASLLSFPLVSIVLMRDPQPGTLRPANPGWVILRTLCAVVAGMAGFYAFSTLPLTQVYAILFTTPLLITILSIPLLVLGLPYLHRRLAATRRVSPLLATVAVYASMAGLIGIAPWLPLAVAVSGTGETVMRKRRSGLPRFSRARTASNCASTSTASSFRKAKSAGS